MSCNAPAGTVILSQARTAAGREPVLEYGREAVRANASVAAVACAAPDNAVIDYAMNGQPQDAWRGRWQLQPLVRPQPLESAEALNESPNERGVDPASRAGPRAVSGLGKDIG